MYKNAEMENEEEIPAITYRIVRKQVPEKKKNIVDDRKEKVLVMTVDNIRKSEIISHKPSLYRFQQTDYQFVKIVGIIIGIQLLPNSRTMIYVDDGTGIMVCFVYADEYLPLFQTHLHGIDDMLVANESEEDQFINKFIKKMALESKRLLNHYPQYNDLHHGDEVTIIGRVVDLRERLIFAWCVRREHNSNHFLHHIHDQFLHLQLHA